MILLSTKWNTEIVFFFLIQNAIFKVVTNQNYVINTTYAVLMTEKSSYQDSVYKYTNLGLYFLTNYTLMSNNPTQI